MAQVLTSEGLADFYATGKMPDYVPPAELAKYDKPANKAIPETEEKPAVSAPDAEKEDEDGLTAAERSEFSEKITKKINAKTRALKQAEAQLLREGREKQAAVKEASDLRVEIAKLKESVKDDGKGPKRADFESDADWWDAKIDWKSEQKAEEKFTALEQKRERERIEAARQKRVAAFAENVPDYQEAIEALDGLSAITNPNSRQAILDYVSEADLGPAIVHYLGTHLDEVDGLAKLSPVAAVAAVGKIESKLERKEAKAEKAEAKTDALDSFKAPISKAPAPIEPLSETVNAVKKDPSTMTVDELRAYNRAQRMRQAG